MARELCRDSRLSSAQSSGQPLQIWGSWLLSNVGWLVGQTSGPLANARLTGCLALKLHRADIADAAYLQNCGVLITGARSLTPAKSIDWPLSLTTSSQHP